MILLTATKIPEGLDKDTLATAVSLMFPDSENCEFIEKMRDKTCEGSACESLFALALLYEQIKEFYSPSDTSKLIILRNAMGKPYFKDSDIKFNISHSKGYVACACAIGEELGVDIEASEISPERVERLAKRYFSDSEYSEIKERPEIFARRWTEKEARAKFLGESVEKILSNDKNQHNSCDSEKICLHRFTVDNIPITLCTKRDFSTIIFTVQ